MKTHLLLITFGILLLTNLNVNAKKMRFCTSCGYEMSSFDWICSECGYMHVATEAWKVCPLCKAEQGYVDLHLPFEGVRK